MKSHAHATWFFRNVDQRCPSPAGLERLHGPLADADPELEELLLARTRQVPQQADHHRGRPRRGPRAKASTQSTTRVTTARTRRLRTDSTTWISSFVRRSSSLVPRRILNHHPADARSSQDRRTTTPRRARRVSPGPRPHRSGRAARFSWVRAEVFSRSILGGERLEIENHARARVGEINGRPMHILVDTDVIAFNSQEDTSPRACDERTSAMRSRRYRPLVSRAERLANITVTQFRAGSGRPGRGLGEGRAGPRRFAEGAAAASIAPPGRTRFAGPRILGVVHCPVPSVHGG